MSAWQSAAAGAALPIQAMSVLMAISDGVKHSDTHVASLLLYRITQAQSTMAAALLSAWRQRITAMTPTLASRPPRLLPARRAGSVSQSMACTRTGFKENQGTRAWWVNRRFRCSVRMPAGHRIPLSRPPDHRVKTWGKAHVGCDTRNLCALDCKSSR
ncbi:hypothetical protein COEREDRAFT_8807 [Coemansia reversa NRRL 1564]|uniref:Uncharacterized protein n=1 Tax=Coemansia reversa (strain ATCC 12441 / NRRL 1564) TaxID=763665 RepID=A0A2G5BAX1_COERN|nr:hypothetical protein COEREDRAFT_8807 [Coemansia reversa NRRL 1564]|eukprot:PIA16150.1 hypothetical protein COEREDRAFT_8807 [Coemansia reversa NRRL 1564]